LIKILTVSKPILIPKKSHRRIEITPDSLAATRKLIYELIENLGDFSTTPEVSTSKLFSSPTPIRASL
jgi:hypothetical protein